jgi:hypothetical protein
MEFDESCDVFEDCSNEFDGVAFEALSALRDDDWAATESDVAGRGTGDDAFAL